MRRKGQAAFEYVLMLAGILLIVILILAILRTTIASSATKQIETNLQAITSINCVPSYVLQRPNNFWKMDEGSGATTTDPFGGYVGSLEGGASWSTGIVGAGINTDSANGAVRVLNSEGLSLAGTSFTIEVWFYRDVWAWNILLQKGLAYGIEMQPDGRARAWYRSLGGAQLSTYTTPIPTEDTSGNPAPVVGSWHHLAMVYEEINEGIYRGKTTLYVDGKQNAVNKFTSKYTPAGSELLYFSDPVLRFKGKIDQVVLVNRALTPGEIYSDYLCPQ